mmetsp:Transcript_28966/g.25621  ORF Transcript_28966/g.25621 Transcript_28966/m.25621 type:complete len:272 (+) Transcript_28966:26-841(+)
MSILLQRMLLVLRNFYGRRLCCLKFRNQANLYHQYLLQRNCTVNKTIMRASTKFLDTKSNHSLKSSNSRISNFSNISKKSTYHKKKKVKIISSKFETLLSGDDKGMSKELRDKMDYFYKPYDANKIAGVPVSVRYDVESPNTKLKVRNFSENSKHNWKSISRQLLNNTNEGFKDLIKAVNFDFYSNIREASKLTSGPRPTKRSISIGLKLFKKVLANKFYVDNEDKESDSKLDQSSPLMFKKKTVPRPTREMINKIKARSRGGSLLRKARN